MSSDALSDLGRTSAKVAGGLAWLADVDRLAGARGLPQPRRLTVSCSLCQRNSGEILGSAVGRAAFGARPWVSGWTIVRSMRPGAGHTPSAAVPRAFGASVTTAPFMWFRPVASRGPVGGQIGGQTGACTSRQGLASARRGSHWPRSGRMRPRRSSRWLFMVRRRSTVRFRKGAPVEVFTF
jgi:hypothetical protein